MWKIGEVKRKGNWAFKKNYWKAVVVAFIFSLLVGGGVSTYNYSANNFNNNHSNQSTSNFHGDGLVGEFNEDINDVIQDELGGLPSVENGVAIAGIVMLVIVFLIVFAIIMVVVVILDVLVINPIEVGSDSFYLKNLNTNAEVKELLSAFDRGSYKNLIKVLFFKDLYTILWTLLFIIPGIVKAYEYRMIPYIMAEHPEMSMEQAFYESKSMMSGNKWHAFLLDLSFIGWYILSVFTLGILSVFYINPYKRSTDAVLYETLRYGNGNIVYSDSNTVEAN